MHKQNSATKEELHAAKLRQGELSLQVARAEYERDCDRQKVIFLRALWSWGVHWCSLVFTGVHLHHRAARRAPLRLLGGYKHHE